MDKKWTSEPPTEPGWYWCRTGCSMPRPREVLLDNHLLYLVLAGSDPVRVGKLQLSWLWWPVPIEEPPR